MFFEMLIKMMPLFFRRDLEIRSAHDLDQECAVFFGRGLESNESW